MAFDSEAYLKKRKRNKVLKFLATIVAIAAVGGGIYYWGVFNKQADADEWAQKADSDQSWNVIHQSTGKYAGEGVYTVTPNGSWSGLIAYVKDDKVVCLSKVEYKTLEDIRNEYFNGDPNVSNEDLHAKLDEVSYQGNPLNSNGFTFWGAANVFDDYAIYGGGSIEFYTQEFDYKAMYKDLVALEIQSGYDKDNNCISFEKLTTNANSPYTSDKGYIVQKWNMSMDIESKCPILAYGDFLNLDASFGANVVPAGFE